MAINARIIEPSTITARLNGSALIIKGNKWEQIEGKPFETVDDETLSTEDGVLKLKTVSYNQLTDLPSIEGVTLEGNKTFAELGIEECSAQDIEKLFSD